MAKKGNNSTFKNIYIFVIFVGQYGETGCYAMGWGAKRFEEKQYQVQMRKVEMPIVRNPECQTLFRDNTRLPDSFNLHDSFICAG